MSRFHTKRLSPWEHDPNAIGNGVTVVLIHEVLRVQGLDFSVAEFILSQAEGLLRNDMGRFDTDSR